MKIENIIYFFLASLIAIIGAWYIAEIKTIEATETRPEFSRQLLAVYLQGRSKPLPEVERNLKAVLARVLPIGTDIRFAKAILVESGFVIDPLNIINADPNVISATKLPFVTDGVFFRTWSSVQIRLRRNANGAITSEDVKLCYSFPTGC